MSLPLMSRDLVPSVVPRAPVQGPGPGACSCRSCRRYLGGKARVVLADVHRVEHVPLHPLAEAVATAADRVPRDIELVVALVVAVRVRGMRAARRERDGTDYPARQHRAARS